jgi:hypothetical protein
MLAAILLPLYLLSLIVLKFIYNTIEKEDGFIMGEDICLGGSDVVENYFDYIYTPEEYEEFYHPTKPSIDEVRYNKLA